MKYIFCMICRQKHFLITNEKNIFSGDSDLAFVMKDTNETYGITGSCSIFVVDVMKK